jgi:zinc D-Ala-D-Ala carboxypeptidase
MVKRYTTLILLSSLSLLLGSCSFLDEQLAEFRTEDETQINNEMISNIENYPKDDSQTEEQEQQRDEWVLEEAFFNQLEEKDGLLMILNPENILSLVNKEQMLPEDYIPEDLIAPEVAFSFGDVDIPQRYLRKEAAEALKILFAEAKKEDIILFAVSGYRSFERQAGIFDNQVKMVGKEQANELVAIPGQSEHQSGLAMDISSHSNNLELSEGFGETIEGKWIKENAHKYGFIIRYPKGKESITGYNYEPWHLRYVGKEISAIIYKNDLTLEEYFDKVKKI